MNSSRDLYARETNGLSRPRTNTTLRDAPEAPQGWYQVGAFQNTTLHQSFSQMQQPTTTSRAYQAQGGRPTATNQDMPAHAYAPSTHPAHQGSRDAHSYDNASGAQHRVNLPGAQHSLYNSRERTARFANEQQPIGHGSSVDEAEQNGIRRGTNTISRFNSQFTGAGNTDTLTQNARRGEGSSNITQYSNPNHDKYTSTVGYNSQSSSSSRTQR